MSTSLRVALPSFFELVSPPCSSSPRLGWSVGGRDVEPFGRQPLAGEGLRAGCGYNRALSVGTYGTPRPRPPDSSGPLIQGPPFSSFLPSISRSRLNMSCAVLRSKGRVTNSRGTHLPTESYPTSLPQRDEVSFGTGSSSRKWLSNHSLRGIRTIHCPVPRLRKDRRGAKNPTPRRGVKNPTILASFQNRVSPRLAGRPPFPTPDR